MRILNLRGWVKFGTNSVREPHEVRIQGRGGQSAVLACSIHAKAFVDDDKYAWRSPSSDLDAEEPRSQPSCTSMTHRSGQCARRRGRHGRRRLLVSVGRRRARSGEDGHGLSALEMIGKYRHLSEHQVAYIQRTVDDRIAYLQQLAQIAISYRATPIGSYHHHPLGIGNRTVH